jgi:hypothetical protein
MEKKEIAPFLMGIFVGFIMLSMYFSNVTSVELVSLLVATLAIVLTFWSHREARRHNKLSVRPFIDSVSRFDDVDCKCGFYLKNAGMGSVVNLKSRMFINGELAVGLVFKREHYNTFRNDKDFITTSAGHTIISPNSEIYLFEMEAESKDSLKFQQIFNFMNKLTFEVTYESVLGDKYEEKFSFAS